jgi:prophage tail gpP-like protein
MSEIKDWPTPGFQYEIQQRDSAKGLSGISRKAYGDGTKWRVIWKANKSSARTDDPNRGFWVGDIITIPGDAPIEEIKEELREDILPTLENKGEDDFSLLINDVEFPLTAGRALLSMDTAADGWTGTTTWSPDNPVIAELLKPYSYNEAAVYIGGKLLIRGYIYKVTPILDVRGSVIDMEGWSFMADAVDSVIKPPYEQSKVTLEKRARDLLEPLGIEVVYNIDEDEPFDRVTAGQQDRIFDHLAGLAKQRAALLTSTPQGKALFTKAETGAPVSVILEDFPPYMESRIEFDGRARFNVYKATAQSPKKSSKTATANDPQVPKSRFMTFSADDATEADLQKAADWQRSKALADALTINFPVNSWYSQEGDLWSPNTIVTVVSPTLFVPNGFDFMIRSVEFIFQPTGTTAVLGLVPPSVYTGEDLVEPWV